MDVQAFRDLTQTADPDRRRQLLAAAAALVPVTVLTAGARAASGGFLSLTDLLVYPLVFGPLFTLWILWLHRGPCADRVETLGWHEGRLGGNLAAGVALAAVLLALLALSQATVYRWLPRDAPPEEIIALVDGLSRRPWLLALWLGPVVWLGVALFEEVMRVFLLRRLWLVWDAPAGRWAVAVAVSVLIGAGHYYQGAAGVISISVMSLLKAWFFLRWRRLWPLVVAHALYDSFQILMAVLEIRGVL